MASPTASRLSRRVFLRSAAVAPIALWSGCNFERGAPSDLPDAASPGTGPVSASPLGMFDPCTPPLTPLGDFPPIFGGDIPDIDPGNYALEIDGLVQRPVSIRLSDLIARSDEALTVTKSMLCIIGLTGTQVWTGLPLRSLLDLAGPDLERTRRLRLYGADGFRETMHPDQIYGVEDGDDLFPPLLAYQIDGKPLPAALGFPFRLLLPDRFGFKNVKWPQRIELSGDDSRAGIFEKPSYSDAKDSGQLQVQTGVAHPLPPRIDPGPTRICGHAMSGHGGIQHVELVIDGGTPVTAELLSRDALLALAPSIGGSLQAQHPERFPYPWRGVWTPFTVDWTAETGWHQIELRVTDRTGAVNDRAMVAFDVD